MKNKDNSERISKVIARSSQYSRRQVEQLIVEGRVRIDGKMIDRPNINVNASNKILLEITKKQIQIFEQIGEFITIDEMTFVKIDGLTK